MKQAKTRKPCVKLQGAQGVGGRAMSVMAAALAIVAGTSHSGNTHVSTKNRRAWIEPSDRRGVAYKLFRDWGKKQPINGAKECARRVRQMAAGQI